MLVVVVVVVVELATVWDEAPPAINSLNQLQQMARSPH
jgi:hypothetical protein